MNASRRVLLQGHRQVCCQSRVAARQLANRATLSTQTVPFPGSPLASAAAVSASSASSSETAAASGTKEAAAPSPKSTAAPAKPATTTPPKPATKPSYASKSFSTSSSSKASPSSSSSSSSSKNAIPDDLFYKPTTIAHADGQGSGAAVANVDWSSSFHGIASQPVTEKQFHALMKPLDVDDIEVKPDGIIYLPEIRYRRRLNEAFGPMGWGLIPKGEAVVGNSVVTREYALIVDGRFVSQAQGENSYFGADQLPSAVEGCKSNALMRCCKDLGIAAELWDPAFIRWFKKNRMEEVWVEHATTKKKRQLWYRKGAVDVAYPYKRAK